MGIRTIFVQFNGLISIVKKYQRKIFHQPFNAIDCYSPVFPTSLAYLFRFKKGCRHINVIFNKSEDSSKAEIKWASELGLSENFSWKSFYTIPYKATKDTRIHWLQFRLLHRILSTNTFLKKIKIKDSEMCTFCDNTAETLLHLFYECPFVKRFWNDFQTLFEVCNIKLPDNISPNVVILGFSGSGNYIMRLNLFILIAKQYIYVSKYNSKNLNINGFLKILHSCYRTEEYTARRNLDIQKFDVIWQDFKTLLSVAY